jgi:hypothetical protein
MRKQIQKSVIWGVLAAESTHVLCCVFPTVFSLISLMVGLGLAAGMPAFMVTMHDWIHVWEVPIILFSGAMLALGWGVTLYADRMDCHDHAGCTHPPCAPKKHRAHLVLTIASILFAFNVTLYVVVHRTLPGLVPTAQNHEAIHDHGHGHHDGHDHP